MENSLMHSDITKTIIGCAMKVHSSMRKGYNEDIYAKCLSIEFNNQGLQYAKEMDIPVYYGEYIVGRRRVDFWLKKK